MSRIPMSVQRLWTRANEWQDLVKPVASCQGVGCNGCCRGEVAVTKEEVAVIAERLTNHEWERVVVAARSTTPKKEPCPLLSRSGACGVYGVRPTTCRTYAVASPKEDCFPENGLKDIALLHAPMLVDLMKPIVNGGLILVQELMIWKAKQEAAEQDIPVFEP